MQEQAGETARAAIDQGPNGLVLVFAIAVVLIFAAIMVYFIRMLSARIDAAITAIRTESERSSRIEGAVVEARKETEEARADSAAAHKEAEKRFAELASTMNRLGTAIEVALAERRLTPHGGIPQPTDLAASVG